MNNQFNFRKYHNLLNYNKKAAYLFGKVAENQ